MAYSVKRVLDSILAAVLENLAGEGFVSGGVLTLIRSTTESVCAFNIQPDKYNTKFQGKFTVNLWLWYPQLGREREENDDNVYKTGGLHLTERLAMLGPPAPGSRARTDTWWEVSETTDPRLISATIHSLWERYGRDWLAQNESLTLALPRVVRQWSEYHAATALYASGDVEGAKKVARTIWRGDHPGFPERIAWAWKRKLFDLADLKAALTDEHYQARLIAIDTLWKIARVDSNITALADGLVADRMLDLDPVVARHVGELRESLYVRNGVLRIIPRDVPALDKLPKNAVIAFGARCARRVQENVPRHWPAVKSEHVEAIIGTLELIEDIAASKRPRSVAKISSKQLEPVRQAAKRAAEKSEEASFAKSAIDSVWWAAQASSGGATAAETAARLSSQAVPEKQAADVRRQIWEDFDLLLEAATRERWDNGTPVGPERFPPLTR